MSRFKIEVDVELTLINAKYSSKMFYVYNEPYGKYGGHDSNVRLIAEKQRNVLNGYHWVSYWIDHYDHFKLLQNVFTNVGKRLLEKKVIRHKKKDYLFKRLFNNKTFVVFPKDLELLILAYLIG